MTESAADFAPIAAWIGSSIRFSPQVSRVYLDVLDERMKALKDALHQGFGVEPSRVLQTTYEPIQYDENGAAVRRAADAGHGRASRPASCIAGA